ncbi:MULTISPECIES: hypothetical protein [Actinomadura]|uniref:Uncharacterized protein n=1 Tax=Actinomadura yumaensis TaxID=111807 RepID=A0ABW2CCV8_9ACTN|nr:hypothetical protein [Actinomadura sp. J1-007]MWK33783.1 hypothetical protein [Actinomadura sp. J1-007]
MSETTGSEPTVPEEAPEADAAEQRAALLEDEEDGPAAHGGPVPYEVNEADAAEQQRVVEIDEDDYR